MQRFTAAMDHAAVGAVLRGDDMLEAYAESFENDGVTGEFLLELVKNEALFQESLWCRRTLLRTPTASVLN